MLVKFWQLFSCSNSRFLKISLIVLFSFFFWTELNASFQRTGLEVPDTILDHDLTVVVYCLYEQAENALLYMGNCFEWMEMSI